MKVHCGERHQCSLWRFKVWPQTRICDILAQKTLEGSQFVNSGSVDSLGGGCFCFLATSVIRLLLLWPNTHEK